MKRLIVALVLVVLLPAVSSAWDRSMTPDHLGRVTLNPTTTIQFMGWDTSMDGIVQVQGNDRLDLDTEADIDDKMRFGFRASHVLSKRSAIEVGYMKLDNNARVERAYTFDGTVYDANANMNLVNRWFDVAYHHNLAHSRNNEFPNRDAFYVDGTLGVKFCKSEVRVSGESAGVAAGGSWSESYPLPYLGLSGGGQISDHFWLKGQVKYMNLKVSGVDALHQDYSINLAYKINPRSVSDAEWFVDLGYRYIKYDIEESNDRAELTYGGPTFGIFARF